MELNMDPARLPFNPFNEAQQVQLRAQIIVYGSLVRSRAPEETLMSLSFADISKGRRIEDFHAGNLRSNLWHKVWQVAWERDRAMRKSGKAPKPAAPKPAAPKPAASKPAASKPAPKPAPKRKTVPISNLEAKAEQKKLEPKKEAPERKVKEKSISELDEFGPSQEDTEQLIEFAASAMKSLGAAAAPEDRKEVYWKSSQDSKANASKDTGDLTDDKDELSGETDEVQKSSHSQMPDEFVKGARVEVVSDEEGLHGVWFAGKINRVRNGKLQIIYEDLLDEAGIKSLQEWVPFYEPENEAPKVRLAHPVSSSDLPLKDAFFSVGDHVDVWMNDGWWEGIVEGIHSDNRKEVTLFFPGEGDIGVAKVSNLRPSLVWKDGRWEAWTQDPEPTVKRVESFCVEEDRDDADAGSGSDSDPDPEPPLKKARQRDEQEEMKPVPMSVKKLGAPLVLLEGKRKRERPKRLEDGLDDDHPPRKPYTRRNIPESTSKAAAMASKAATKKRPKAKKSKK